MGLAQVVAAGADEQVFFGHDTFRDADDFKRVTAVVDADPRIGELYRTIQQAVDLATVVRWEADGAG